MLPDVRRFRRWGGLFPRAAAVAVGGGRVDGRRWQCFNRSPMVNSDLRFERSGDVSKQRAPAALRSFI